MTSLLDQLYARVSNRRLFFNDGWGDLSGLKDAQSRGYDPGPITKIEIEWTDEAVRDKLQIRHGWFPSPYGGAGLPQESRHAFVEWIMPEKSSKDTPVSLHFAATGDEGFSRRRTAFAQPLVSAGIGSMILENPFYGKRRPAGQHSKMLRRFSDLWTMGIATVQEGRSLSRWLFDEGYRLQISCGISMGGHMAAKVGTLSDVPMAIACFVTPHCASAVFTEGLLKNYCAWHTLDKELNGEGKALDLMKEFLYLTDIRLVARPKKPQGVIMIGAQKDAYIPQRSVQMLHSHWPGSTLRWIKSGHVGAFLFYRKTFLNAVTDAVSTLTSCR